MQVLRGGDWEELGRSCGGPKKSAGIDGVLRRWACFIGNRGRWAGTWSGGLAGHGLACTPQLRRCRPILARKGATNPAFKALCV